MAFGDSKNDNNILVFAEIGVAMANADPNTKIFADYITDSINNNEIYDALRYFQIL